MGTIRIESGDQCDWVRLALGRANAVGPAFLTALEGALDDLTTPGGPPGLELDAPARPVLLTGEGSAFSAGLDLPTLLEMDRMEMTTFLANFDRTFRRVATLPRPLIAVINGHAVAGGAVLALACDLRVAARGTAKGASYVFGLREAALGLPVPNVVMEIVAAALPAGSVRTEALLTGSLYGPEEAKARGLVDILVDPGDLEAVALRAAGPYTQATGRASSRLKAQLRPELYAGFGQPRDEGPFLDAWFSAETRTRLQAVVDALRR